MKVNRSLLISFSLLVVIAALYRIIPGRAPGFAPQWAMAVFGGAIIKDKKWAFALPVISMFISDLLYQGMYNFGWTNIPGFYTGQLTNYILFACLTFIGFFIRKINLVNVLLASLAAPTIYFLISNLLVWSGGGGLERARTLGGLMQTYTDGLPFYKNSLLATLVFSTILFGTYFLVSKPSVKPQLAK